MMNRRTTSILFSLLIASTLCGTSDAEIVLRFSTDGGSTFGSQTTANPNDTVTLGVYAVEIGGDTRLSTLGLYNVGTKGTFNTGVGTIMGKRPNSGLGLFFPANPANDPLGTVELSGIASDFFTPVLGSAILVGEFDYQLSRPGITDFAFGDLSGVDDFELGAPGSLIGLDTELFSIDPIASPADRSRTYGYRISAVPEPASYLFLCVVSLVAVVHVSRRRRSRDSDSSRSGN